MKTITKKEVDAYVDAYIAMDEVDMLLDSAEDLERIATAVGKSFKEKEESYVNPRCADLMTHRYGFDYRGVAFYVLSDTPIKNFDEEEIKK